MFGAGISEREGRRGQRKGGGEQGAAGVASRRQPLPYMFMTAIAAPPVLIPMTQVLCEVSPLVTLGAAPYGERRYIPLGGGTAQGPELNGTLVEGGVDWQIKRGDGVLDISARYVIQADDGALIEVTSEGMRHGPVEVMAPLARGEDVPREAYFFRILIRFQTGARQWLHLNKTMALACGRREATPGDPRLLPDHLSVRNVIPAKAGIQHRRASWIPACAGMTDPRPTVIPAKAGIQAVPLRVFPPSRE